MTRPTNAERIRSAINRTPDAIDLEPRSAYEAMTRAKVDDIERELAQVRGRLDTLIWAVVGAVVVSVVMQLMGGG